MILTLNMITFASAQKVCICFETKCKTDSIRELVVYIVEAKQKISQYAAKKILIYLLSRTKMLDYGLF